MNKRRKEIEIVISILLIIIEIEIYIIKFALFSFLNQYYRNFNRNNYPMSISQSKLMLQLSKEQKTLSKNNFSEDAL
jgi:hypothetical protein